MDIENQESGISLQEIGQTIWKYKILVVIITTAVLLLGLLLVWRMNKNNTLISTPVEYQFLNVQNGTFADGSVFHFRDLISLEYLELAQASDAKFASIDVEAIAVDSNTSITRRVSELSTENNVALMPNYFNIVINFRHFNRDKELARDFILALTNIVYEKAIAANQTVKPVNLLDLVTDDVDYLEAFDLYQQQYISIINGYNSFVSLYGNVSISNQRIDEMRAELTSWYNLINFSDLKLEIINNAYIRNYQTFSTRIAYRIQTLNQTFFENARILTELEDFFDQAIASSNIQQADALLERIVTLKQENVKLGVERDQLQGFIDAGGNNMSTSLESTFTEIEQTLAEHLEFYQSFQIDHLNQQTSITYQYGYVYQTSGSISLFVGAVVSIFVGLLLAFAVVFIKESMLKPKEPVKQTV